MKITIILVVILLQTTSGYSGGFMNHRIDVSTPPRPEVPKPIILVPRDPYRVVDGSVWNLTGIDSQNGWVGFSGKVLEVQPTGVRVEGYYTGYGYGDAEFFVQDFPYQVAEGETLQDDAVSKTFYCAKKSGTYTYSTAIGGSRTIRKLEYGTIYVPPPLTSEQIEAANKAAAAAKENEKKKADEGRARALKLNQSAADKGDAYGLLRMGERYRDGEGVEKDLVKARDYLAKAVTAGSPSAQAELDALPK